MNGMVVILIYANNATISNITDDQYNFWSDEPEVITKI